MVKVLITYGWCRTSYVVLRQLANYTDEIYFADENRFGMCQLSNKINISFVYTSFLEDEIKFIDDLNKVISQIKCRFLFPSHDETEIIAKYRDKLPEDLIIPIASYENIKWANDKWEVYRTCRDLNINVPNAMIFDKDINSTDFPFPSVVKIRSGNSAKGVFYPENREDIKTIASECIEKYNLTPERYPIIQEKVDGEGWGVSCLYWEGECLAHFTHKRLREKTLTGGTSTSRISKNNLKIEKMAIDLLNYVGWHGLAMVEFKYNPKTNEAWIIEINPRLWGSIYLSVQSGVDFPAWLYLAATQGPNVVRNKFNGQKEGVIARWYIGELIYAIQMLKKGRLYEALKAANPLPISQLDDVHLDDLGAFVGEILYYFSTFAKTRSINPEKKSMLR